ncbi:hypothetical protein UFOVP1219_62 [uncultured Caudovirales phage]|uniref:Uncharacterized protein n=1 Tax=uncultured Caudovirales phage TaxID=2100421 RepID=A0A6J5RIG6_9CAUD|nr:hypothetical protein UFOVP476_34 [uncultured Caudovirales phage]CAB4176519.1 hypothetical protein UFOVP986_41 [uncultured Caudovirales phage]CAB4191544.1 hypothetical protein UFOVP1219_62 [uncultured Caudovirales phage]CAB4223289.1 hypothetical protein UFOVP1671_37 [uncultured Caudovirales phage]CAB5220612.1 hypothetical protein UFOVP358_70 [uncultured Caudovirales phage]
MNVRYLERTITRLRFERGWFDTDHPKDQEFLDRIDLAIEAIQNLLPTSPTGTSERGSS